MMKRKSLEIFCFAMSKIASLFYLLWVKGKTSLYIPPRRLRKISLYTRPGVSCTPTLIPGKVAGIRTFGRIPHISPYLCRLCKAFALSPGFSESDSLGRKTGIAATSCFIGSLPLCAPNMHTKTVVTWTDLVIVP